MTLINIRPVFSGVATVAVLVGTMTMAHAAPINPQFDTFGVLNDSTGDNVEFGGDGISNQAVAITRFTDSGNEVTLGLAATPRGPTVPPVGNDGAGTFSATPGEFPDGATDNNRALWSFSFFAEVAGGGMLTDYIFDLFYDFDPATGTDAADHGRFNAGVFVGNPASTTTSQGSQNLGFDYLEASAFIANAPAFTPFDPTVNGEYSFALQASDLNGNVLGTSAIRVNVGQVATVPEPASIALFGVGLAGLLGAAGFRRRQSSCA